MLSVRTRGDRDMYPKAPHIITPGDGPNLDSSKKDFLPLVRPDSSLITPLKTLLFVSSFKGSRSHGLQAESPCCCKRHRTIRADTCCLANALNC
ncbi:hypothetical protein TNCV_2307881 [Trichonephila clavipes]|nr:hypothetical protein TNCV_2307881 [Trichonephila clavipes]